MSGDTLTPAQRFYHDHIRCLEGGGACVLPSGHEGLCSMSFHGYEELEEELRILNKLLDRILPALLGDKT